MGLLSQCILESELSAFGLDGRHSHTISKSESLLSACTARYISESELSAVGWLFYIGNTIDSELSAVGLDV